MAEDNLNKLIQELENKVKNKRIELENIGKEVNQLLNEKLKTIEQTNSLKEKLQTLKAEERFFEKNISELKESNKKENEVIKTLRFNLNTDEAKLKAKKEQFEIEKERTDNNLKHKEKDIEKDKLLLLQKIKELDDVNKKHKELQNLLDAELNKAELLIREYQVKLKEIQEKQDELNINIDRSKEVKEVLDNKISEAEELKIKLEALIKANQEKEKSLDKQSQDSNKKLQELLELEKQLNIDRQSVIDKDNSFTEREKQLHLKELRILKLAKDKDVQKELKQLEEELAIK